MASVGYYLRKEREKKKIPLEQVSEQTKISIRYLKAIETDDYTIFPGETYIIGFIRNYARALELDYAEVINMYKSMKIGSQTSESEESEKSVSQMIYQPQQPVKKEKFYIEKPSAVKKTEKVKTDQEQIDVVEIDNDNILEETAKEKNIVEKLESLNIFKIPLKGKKLINLAHVVIGAGAVIGLILLILFINFIYSTLSKGQKDKIYTELSQVNALDFEGDILQTDFVPNEYYKIKLGNKEYNILFEKLSEITDANEANKTDTAVEFVFHIGDTTIPLKLKEEKSFDFNYDNEPDLSVVVNSYYNELINGKIKKLHAFVDVETNNLSGAISMSNSKTNRKNMKKKIGKGQPAAAKQKIILTATVREKTYIKAFIDGKEQEGIIYYPKDKINIEANEVLQLKIGNAGGINANINGKPTVLGKRGEIANKIIKWETDPYDESTYLLIIKDWQ